MCKRLVIFVFYDKDGILDDYVRECLRSLHRDVGEVIFTVNGLLTGEGRAKIAPYTEKIIQRENNGLDAWAFKEVLEHPLCPPLSNYDEIVLMNDTCFGPLYPWKELFGKMRNRSDLDFWGLTSTSLPLKKIVSEQRICGRHIDSYFTVFRQRLICDPCFHDYWHNLPPVNDYEDAVTLHEQQICEYFAQRGFRWGTACSINEKRDHVFFSPYHLISDQRCPLLKRRCLTHPVFSDYLYRSSGSNIYNTLSYIEEHADYDSRLIWQHVFRFSRENTVLRNLGVSNDTGAPFAENLQIKITSLPRTKARLSCGEITALILHRILKIPKNALKILLYPFLRTYILRQREAGCAGRTDAD